MRAELDKDGRLTVSADTECESYALQQWGKSEYIIEDNRWRGEKFVIDWGLSND